MNINRLLSILLVCLCIFCQSCDDNDEPNVKFKDITLLCGNSYTIPNGNNISWTSSNKYIASVSNNTITAERIGEATISSSKGAFKVTVNGTTPTAYSIPCIEWGASKSTVKSFMKGKTIDEETSTTLTYKGSGTQLFTKYTFENNKLDGSSLALYGNVNSENLIDFMLERYIPISYDESNYSFYFCTTDNKTVLGLMLDYYAGSIVYIIVYIPRSNSRSLDEFNWSQHYQFERKNSDIVKEQYNKLKNFFIVE